MSGENGVWGGCGVTSRRHCRLLSLLSMVFTVDSSVGKVTVGKVARLQPTTPGSIWGQGQTCWIAVDFLMPETMLRQ